MNRSHENTARAAAGLQNLAFGHAKHTAKLSGEVAEPHGFSSCFIEHKWVGKPNADSGPRVWKISTPEPPKQEGRTEIGTKIYRTGMEGPLREPAALSFALTSSNAFIATLLRLFSSLSIP